MLLFFVFLPPSQFCQQTMAHGPILTGRAITPQMSSAGSCYSSPSQFPGLGACFHRTGLPHHGVTSLLPLPLNTYSCPSGLSLSPNHRTDELGSSRIQVATWGAHPSLPYVKLCSTGSESARFHLRLSGHHLNGALPNSAPSPRHLSL